MKKDNAFYAAIADSVGADDAVIAYARLAAETVTETLPEARIAEADVLRGMGMASGAALLAKLEAALPGPVVRMMQSDGIDVAHPESSAVLDSLLSGSVITQGERDWLDAQKTKASLKYPGLVLDNVVDAIRLRQEGKV